jgi:hypothetical protein
VVPSTAIVVLRECLAQQRLHDLDPAADLVEVVQLVAAVTEHELRLDVDERLRRDLLMRTVLGFVVVVVELAIRAGSVGGDEGQEGIPCVAHMDVISRRWFPGEPHGAFETPLAQPGFEMVAHVLDAEAGCVDRLEQVGGELLVRREGGPLGRLLRPCLAGSGMLRHRLRIPGGGGGRRS